MSMSQIIRQSEELGAFVRAVRMAQNLSRDELANATGLSPKFISQVEGGKATAQLGKVLQLLDELGIRLRAETSFLVSAEALARASRRRRKTGAAGS
ncbi:helix-turn-helix domain-containing protein [Trinickia caryophylli]|uniref:helix-turn-helix domain-containing protein n=1 Tax=Trinickia caryophylli TaxID=28094 RepID=UPI00363693AF